MKAIRTLLVGVLFAAGCVAPGDKLEGDLVVTMAGRSVRLGYGLALATEVANKAGGPIEIWFADYEIGCARGDFPEVGTTEVTVDVDDKLADPQQQSVTFLYDVAKGTTTFEVVAGTVELLEVADTILVSVDVYREDATSGVTAVQGQARVRACF